MKKSLAKIIKYSTLFVGFLFCSCASNKNLEIQPTVVIPPRLTKLPVIKYIEPGIKYECESMLLHNFLVLYDENASGQHCTRILDEAATAKLKVQFPAGTYEILISEKAFDSEHSAFYVYVDETPYRVYPSTPPLGDWELTTRTPIYFTIDEARTILITIQPNSTKKPGSTGMNLDYIQIIKR